MAVQNKSRYIKFGIYIILLVLLNVAGLTLYMRADFTKNRIYSLSKVSRDVVSTLKEPLTISVFFTKNLPAPYNTVERYLRDLLEEYGLSGNRYFNYRFYDVTPLEEGGSARSAENQRLASDYGIQPVQIQAIEQDEVKIKKAYMGLAIVHGDMVEKVPTITSADGLEYQLTTAMMKANNKISALLKLEKPVEIKLYISPSIREVAPYMGLKDLPGLDNGINEIVTELNRTMYGKLSFSTVEPSGREEIAALADEHGLMHLKWPDIPQSGVTAGSGVIGMTVEYGGQSMLLPVLQVFRVPLFGTQYTLATPEEIDEMITGSVESLIGINQSIGYLTSHGALPLYGMPGSQTEPATSFVQLLSRSYSLKQVDLRDGGIPEGLKTFVMAGPTEDFSDYELYRIDQALMRGANLALFLDSFQEIMPQQGNLYGQMPQYVPNDTGLEKLLDHYGMRINRSIVMDENCFTQRSPRQYGGGEQKIYYAPIIQNRNINRDIACMANIKSMVGLAMSPLEIDEKRLAENKITAKRLFSSSDRSWEMRNNVNLNPMFISPPAGQDEFRSYPLAYMLEGNFPSYFADKPVPERPAAPGETADAQDGEKPAPDTDLSGFEGTTTLASSARPGRIFVVASSHLLRNNVLDAEGQTPNSTFVMNVLDVLNDREDVALMRSKTLSLNPLNDPQAQTKIFIKSLNIVGLPVLVAGFGLLVLLRRHVRKSRIELMFSKRGES
ncbi:MAG: Gldg family protein [Desulfomonilia bacterium]|jgi:ABC-type uncharacterized transport system involved in gliding motility auxiliary subunit|nr:Gldg family protein [Desulfomonilia bacterium]